MPISSGETPDLSRDRARVALLRHLPLGASPWMIHRPEGYVECWWSATASLRIRLGGARPWGRRGCRSGGSGCFTSAGMRRGRLVSNLYDRASWSSTRAGRGSGAGVDVGAAAPDSHLRLVASRGFGVGLGCLGNVVVDPCGARPRGRRGVFSSCIFFFLGFALHVCSSYINRKGKAFGPFQKKI